MKEISLENLAPNDWKLYLRKMVMGKQKRTVEYESRQFGFVNPSYHTSKNGTEVMDAHYMIAGKSDAIIRVGFSKLGRAESFSIFA